MLCVVSPGVFILHLGVCPLTLSTAGHSQMVQWLVSYRAVQGSPVSRWDCPCKKRPDIAGLLPCGFRSAISSPTVPTDLKAPAGRCHCARLLPDPSCPPASHLLRGFGQLCACAEGQSLVIARVPCGDLSEHRGCNQVGKDSSLSPPASFPGAMG